MQPDQPAAPFHLPRWAVPLAIVSLYLATCLWVIASADKSLFIGINSAAKVLPDLLWTNLSLMGNGWGIYAFLFPALLFAPRLLIASLIASPMAGVLARVTKTIANTPRPASVLDASQFHLIGSPLFHSSMPSGHAITAFAVATAIYLTLWRCYGKRMPWLFLLATAICISRIAVGAHWPSDVLVGAAIGTISGVLGAWLTLKIPQTKLQTGSWSLWLLAALGLVSAIMMLTTEMDFRENKASQYVLAFSVFVTLGIFVRRNLGTK